QGKSSILSAASPAGLLSQESSLAVAPERF
ncbi:hypothetical protein THAOC_26390, partial [Thalassiosira oceanica]